jgi:hypothetical protein
MAAGELPPCMAHGGGGERLEAASDVPVGDCGRALECGGGAEAGCPPPALHLALIMDSQSISMAIWFSGDYFAHKDFG